MSRLLSLTGLIFREIRKNAQGNQEKWPRKFPVRKTQGIWTFCQNTENSVCPSSKFTDSKDAVYCDMQDTAIFPQKCPTFKNSVSLMAQVSDIGTGKIFS